jgi:hypothetical protein
MWSTRPEEVTVAEWAWVQHFHKQYPNVGLRRLILHARYAIEREGAYIDWLKRNGWTETGATAVITVETNKEK